MDLADENNNGRSIEEADEEDAIGIESSGSESWPDPQKHEQTNGLQNNAGDGLKHPFGRVVATKTAPGAAASALKLADKQLRRNGERSCHQE